MSVAAEKRALPRVLGLFDVSILASAAMGPAYSLAATMGPMVAAAGNGATLALALLAGVMVCIALAFSQLTRVMPNAGSSFSWIASAFGRETGSYAAWLLLLSNYFATMTTALPAATYTLDLFAPGLAVSPLWDAAVGALWIVASTILLYFGLRPTAFTTAIFLLAELGVVAASAIAALIVHPAPERAIAASVPLPNPALGIVTAMVLAIWMIDGWEVSAAASEEATGPAETPGRGGIVALLTTTAILLFAMTAYVHVGSVAGFTANQTDAMGYVADRLGGPICPRLDGGDALDDDPLSLAERIRDGSRRRVAERVRSPRSPLDADERTAARLRGRHRVYVAHRLLADGGERSEPRAQRHVGFSRRPLLYVRVIGDQTSCGRVAGLALAAGRRAGVRCRCARGDHRGRRGAFGSDDARDRDRRPRPRNSLRVLAWRGHAYRAARSRS
jgi:hypothetical protein